MKAHTIYFGLVLIHRCFPPILCSGLIGQQYSCCLHFHVIPSQRFLGDMCQAHRLCLCQFLSVFKSKQQRSRWLITYCCMCWLKFPKHARVLAGFSLFSLLKLLYLILVVVKQARAKTLWGMTSCCSITMYLVHMWTRGSCPCHFLHTLQPS